MSPVLEYFNAFIFLVVRSLVQHSNHKNKGDNASVLDDFTEVVPLQTEVRRIQVNGPAQNAEIEISREDMIKKGELEGI